MEHHLTVYWKYAEQTFVSGCRYSRLGTDVLTALRHLLALLKPQNRMTVQQPIRLHFTTFVVLLPRVGCPMGFWCESEIVNPPLNAVWMFRESPHVVAARLDDVGWNDVGWFAIIG